MHSSRFHDLLTLEVPAWVVTPFTAVLPSKSSPLYEELFQIQFDAEMKAFYGNGEYANMWRTQQCQHRYPQLRAKAELFILAPSTTWHVESAFSAVVHLLPKTRNRLNLTDSGDLRIRLSKCDFDLKDLI